MIKFNYILSTLIFFVPMIISCTSTSEKVETEQSKINESFLENIRTTKTVLSNQRKELVLTGKVEYDPDKVVVYTPLISGIIERTYFSLGDKVQKGQVLLDIRSSDLSSLQSEHIASELELKIAERELQTAQSMYDDKMLSEKELLEAQARLKQAQALLNKLNSDMSAFGRNKGNGVFSIKSPMTGYIVEKKISSGSPVSSDSDPLFIVADLNNIWITVNVYASNLQSVREGMDVEIKTLSYPDETFTGKINTLSQVFDSEEKILKARIVMSNKELKFKPEMSVVVKLKDQSKGKMVAVPSDALIFDNDRYYVVVAKSQDDFSIKEVSLQGHDNSTTYIRSGLDENEDVVVRNQLLIYSALKEK